MELFVCQNEREWVDTTHAQIVYALKRIGPDVHAKIYLPAGETPKPLYQYWRSTKPEVLDQVGFVQIDEILRVPSADNMHPFAQFFRNELGDYVENMTLVGDEPVQADIAILGLGMNGHVGFHEPGIDSGFSFGCVKLSTETCQRLGVANGTWGQTYGLGMFLNCSTVVLIVRGEKKKPILKKMMAEAESVPASRLMHHANLKVIVDFPL